MTELHSINLLSWDDLRDRGIKTQSPPFTARSRPANFLARLSRQIPCLAFHEMEPTSTTSS